MSFMVDAEIFSIIYKEGWESLDSDTRRLRSHRLRQLYGELVRTLEQECADVEAELYDRHLRRLVDSVASHGPVVPPSDSLEVALTYECAELTFLLGFCLALKKAATPFGYGLDWTTTTVYDETICVNRHEFEFANTSLVQHLENGGTVWAQFAKTLDIQLLLGSKWSARPVDCSAFVEVDGQGYNCESFGAYYKVFRTILESN